jgi:hypothetical protein
MEPAGTTIAALIYPTATTSVFDDLVETLDAGFLAGHEEYYLTSQLAEGFRCFAVDDAEIVLARADLYPVHPTLVAADRRSALILSTGPRRTVDIPVLDRNEDCALICLKLVELAESRARPDAIFWSSHDGRFDPAALATQLAALRRSLPARCKPALASQRPVTPILQTAPERPEARFRVA